MTKRLLVRLRCVAGDEVRLASLLEDIAAEGARFITYLKVCWHKWHCRVVALHACLVCVVQRLYLCATARHSL